MSAYIHQKTHVRLSVHGSFVIAKTYVHVHQLHTQAMKYYILLHTTWMIIDMLLSQRRQTQKSVSDSIYTKLKSRQN